MVLGLKLMSINVPTIIDGLPYTWKTSLFPVKRLRGGIPSSFVLEPLNIFFLATVTPEQSLAVIIQPGLIVRTKRKKHEEGV